MKLLSFLFAFVAGVFSASSLKQPITTFAKDYNSTTEQSNFEATDVEYWLTCINPEQSSQNHTLSFNYTCSVNILNITTNDITNIVCNIAINGNEANIFVETYLDEFDLVLGFELEEDISPERHLYLVNNDDTLYSSDKSLDQALSLAGFDLNYDLLEDPDDEELIEAEEEDESGEIPNRSGWKKRLSGYLRWKDDNGVVHPLAGAKVILHLTAYPLEFYDYTRDSDGYYSFSLDDFTAYCFGSSASLRIYTNGDYIRVTNGSSTYCYKENFSSLGTSSYTFSKTFEMNDNFGKAVQVYEAGYYFAKYANTMVPNKKVRKCSIKYPNYSDGSFYSPDKDMITLSAYNNADCPKTYTCWDVIGHEYGHHVQNCFGMSFSGAKHTITDNLIDYLMAKQGLSLETAKERALELSWGESFPTFWSTVAQKTFPDDIKTIAYVGDTKYTASNGVKFNLNQYNGTVLDGGECTESTIMRVLYKLNSPETDAYDKFAIPESTLWSIIVDNKITTFGDFIDELYCHCFNSANLGLLLRKFRLVTTRIDLKQSDILNPIQGYFLDVPPEFEWDTDYGTNTLSYNHFRLLIYANNRLLLDKNINTNHYELTRNEWNTICSSGATTYSVMLGSQQTNYVDGGTYYSELFSFNIPTEYYYSSIIVDPNDWGFTLFSSSSSGTLNCSNSGKQLKISYSTSHCYGLVDWISLVSNGVNNGNSYMQMTFDKPVTNYTLDLAFLDDLGTINSAYIQEKDSRGRWNTKCNLINSSISTDIYHMSHLSFDRVTGIYGIKIVISSTGFGFNGGGTLCLGRMSFTPRISITDITNPDLPIVGEK